MTHPEEAAAQRWMRGRTVEIGAGSNPTPGVHLTIDRTPAGQTGTAGCEHGKTSKAAICADMAHLPLAAGSFDALVARHVLEHHPDTLTILREWARVAARLVIICPDQNTYPASTIALDPTHHAAFTPTQLAATARHAGLSVAVRPLIPEWSFLLVADSIPEAAA